MGGLGNQMFQYALGRKLSLVNNDIFKLDISDYNKQNSHATKREYKLKFFNILENIAEEKEVIKLKGGKLLNNKIFNKLGIRYKTYIKEKITNVFDPKILNLKGNIYLEGYWQNEKYFKDIRNILLKEFTLKNNPPQIFYELLDDIKNMNSVAIHIRGGDYVKDKETSKFHGILSIDYYTKAIKIFIEKLKDPKFFVFTDDTEYANMILNELKINYVLVNQHNLADYEELILMSNFKNFIIANSSFSWWGAWLSDYKDKIVASPSIWFADSKLSSINLSPDSWIKI
jgi:virulence-associated protein VapD